MEVVTKSEFIGARGGAAKVVRAGTNLWLLPDGSAIVRDVLSGERLFDAATFPPVERLRSRERYWSTVLERAEKHFHQLKAAAEGGRAFYWPKTDDYQHDLYGPDPRDAVRALETIRDAVMVARAELAKVRAELDADPTEQRERDAARRAAEADGRLRAALDHAAAERQHAIGRITI